ncbi:MAG: BatA domain-containing protein, partial [Anaerotignaceae bacterium]
MNFLNPWGLLGLLGVPVIVLFYILKQKYKVEEIPNLALWKAVIEQNEGSKWRQKLKKNLLMILQILAVVLGSLALANPVIVGNAQRSNYIFAIDTSFSMQSTDENGSRLNKAKSDAINIVENSPTGTVFSIVNFNNNPSILINKITDKNATIKAINALTPTYSSRDDEGAITLIKSLGGDTEENTLVFTDTPIKGDIVQPSHLIYGKSNDNYYISLVSKAENQVLVRVERSGTGEEKQVNVGIFGDGVIIDSYQILIGGGKSADVVFNLEQNGYREITAKVLEEDILTADNAYSITENKSEIKKALLVSSGNIFIEKSFSLINGIELYKKTPDNEILNGYDFYIFDGFLPETLPTDGQLLIINPPESSFFEILEETEILTTTLSTSQLTQNIEDMAFYIESAKILNKPNWANTALTSAQGDLVFYGENLGQKTVVITFDLRQSPFPLKKEFPIFMYNIANYFLPHIGGSNLQFFAGSLGNLNILPTALNVEVISPSGNKTTINSSSGFTQTNEIGLYTLKQSLYDNSENISYFVVNPVTTGES